MHKLQHEITNRRHDTSGFNLYKIRYHKNESIRKCTLMGAKTERKGCLILMINKKLITS
jgi:hypothetical protein